MKNILNREGSAPAASAAGLFLDRNLLPKLNWWAYMIKSKENKGQFGPILKKTRRGSPVDRRPSTAEAPPTGEIHPFSKMAVTFEPLIGF